MIERLTQFSNLNILFLLVGLTIGVTIGLNHYQKEEIRFLFLQTYNIHVISLFHIFKMMIPLLGICFVLLTSLLLYHGPIKHLLELQIEFILGYLLGGNLSYLFNLNKKQKFLNIISGLLVLIPSCVNGYLSLKVIAGILFIVCFFKFSNYHWEGYLYHSRHLTEFRKKVFLSKKPVLKKELFLLLQFQRILPLAFVLICAQFVFYILNGVKSDFILIIALIIVGIMHDAWTLNSIGLEESTIKLYLYSRLPLKKLISTKWMFCFMLTTLIGAINYVFWGIYYNEDTINIIQNTLILILFSYLMSTLYICIGIFFTDFDRRTYYRINLKGIIACIVCVILLFLTYFISVNFLLIESVLITFPLLKLLNSEEKLRELFQC